MMVSFTTKDGRRVSFTPKGEKKKKRAFGKRSRRRSSSKSRARPTTVRRQTMARQRRRRSGGGNSSGGLVNVLLGGAVAGFVESIIPFGNAGKIGACVLAHKQGGVIGNTAKALGVLGTARIVQGGSLTTGLSMASQANSSSSF